MDDALFEGSLKQELERRAGLDRCPELAPLLRELWSRRDEAGSPHELKFEAAEALGPQLVDRSISSASAMRLLLGGGRGLVEVAQSSGLLSAEQQPRLQRMVDEAMVQAASSLEQARRNRRQQWLSFLSHEIKNPLNTMLNALWLLREKGDDRKQASHFIDLAERAVRRLEGRVKDLRQLDEQLATAPPGWEAQRVLSAQPVAHK